MALSTSRTVLTQTGINTFLNYDIGGLNSAGIATFASFRGDGSQLTGIDATSIKNGSDVKVQANASGAVVTGVLTATSMVVGSAVTSNSHGIDVTGVVTATSLDVDGHTNLDNVSIAGVTTFAGLIDSNAGLDGSGQFVWDAADADVIIRDSTDSPQNWFYRDHSASKLYLGTTSNVVELRSNLLTNADSTYDIGTNSVRWRNLYADTLYGDGSNLTGIDATSIKNSGGNVKIQGNNSGATLTGIMTAVGGNSNEGAFISPTAVGVGTTTTTGRNAGVTTAKGTLIFNTTVSELQVWMGDVWVAAALPPPLSATGGTKSTSSRSNYTVHTFFSPGTFSVATGSADSGDVEVFVVAGGGSGGGGRHSGGGGAGAIRYSTTQTLAPGSYSVTVGSGGASGPQSSPGRNNGANSVFGTITATGGGGGGAHPWNDAGAPGGSGGGEAHSSAGAGTGSGDPGGSTNSVSPANGWGNNGGNINYRSAGGGGGGSSVNGGNGSGTNENSTNTGGTGGDGIQYSTDGTSYYYAAGGGGSANPGSCEYGAVGGPGGTGGGGGGAACGGRITGGQSGGSGGGSARNGGSSGSASNSSPQNVANGGNAGSGTGSGGGAAAGWAGYGGGTGGSGGPGLVIVAYPTALTE